jgi:hypothetical protein
MQTILALPSPCPTGLLFDGCTHGAGIHEVDHLGYTFNSQRVVRVLHDTPGDLNKWLNRLHLAGRELRKANEAFYCSPDYWRPIPFDRLPERGGGRVIRNPTFRLFSASVGAIDALLRRFPLELYAVDVTYYQQFTGHVGQLFDLRGSVDRERLRSGENEIDMLSHVVARAVHVVAAHRDLCAPATIPAVALRSDVRDVMPAVVRFDQLIGDFN